jgi:hypothetical protein
VGHTASIRRKRYSNTIWGEKSETKTLLKDMGVNEKELFKYE